MFSNLYTKNGIASISAEFQSWFNLRLINHKICAEIHYSFHFWYFFTASISWRFLFLFFIDLTGERKEEKLRLPTELWYYISKTRRRILFRTISVIVSYPDTSNSFRLKNKAKKNSSEKLLLKIRWTLLPYNVSSRHWVTKWQFTYCSSMTSRSSPAVTVFCTTDLFSILLFCFKFIYYKTLAK